MGSPQTPADTCDQEPIAVVLACTDDPLDCAVVFDQPADALRVVRSLNHDLDGVLGAIEYAVDVLSVPLVVVLGHEDCAALSAGDPRQSTTAITDHRRKSLGRKGSEPAAGPTAAPEVRHVTAVCQQLVQRSPSLKQQADAGDCAVVGAVRQSNGRVELCCNIGDVGETVSGF